MWHKFIGKVYWWPYKEFLNVLPGNSGDAVNSLKS